MEVIGLASDDEYERHRLLVLIESMQRDDRSEREIAAAVRDATCRRRPAAAEPVPAALRLARWTLARIGAQ